MHPDDVDGTLLASTNALAEELIALTPPSMTEIQFEIVATEDGGADIGLLENHPDVLRVALSRTVYECCSQYLPLVKHYAAGWRRSLITLRQGEEGWKITVDYEYE